MSESAQPRFEDPAIQDSNLGSTVLHSEFPDVLPFLEGDLPAQPDAPAEQPPPITDPSDIDPNFAVTYPEDSTIPEHQYRWVTYFATTMSAPLRRFIASRVPDSATRSDIFQQLFINLAEARTFPQTFETPEKLVAFIYTCCSRRIADHYRQQGRDRADLHPDLDENIALARGAERTYFEDKYLEELMERACQDLTPEQARRFRIILHCLELPAVELAPIIGVGSATAARVAKHRILNIVRGVMLETVQEHNYLNDPGHRRRRPEV